MRNVTTHPIARTPITPPIPLMKEREEVYEKGLYMTLKLRSNPSDKHSPTHEIQVPYFKSGTAEQFLEFMDKVSAVIVGQNLNSGAKQFAFMRQVLKGDALAHFNYTATERVNEDEEDFIECIKALTKHVFPQRALQVQKRYMRRFMRKPREMKMREYRNRVVELNGHLARFPPEFDEKQKLDDEELIDILAFGVPNTWTREMVRLDFDPAREETTIQDLVEFCERQEFIEAVNEGDKKPAAKSKPGPSGKTGQTGGEGVHSGQPKNARAAPSRFAAGRRPPQLEGRVAYDSSKYCELHNVYGHDLASCHVMRDQAQKMHHQWVNKPDQLDRRHEKRQHEKQLHAYVQNMVNNALKQEKKKRKASDKEVHFTEDSTNDDDRSNASKEYNQYDCASIDYDEENGTVIDDTE
jgi:hypothetical protein